MEDMVQTLRLVHEVETVERYRRWYDLPSGGYLIVSYPKTEATTQDLFVVKCEKTELYPYEYTISTQWCLQKTLDLWLSNNGYKLEVPAQPASDAKPQEQSLNLDQTISWKVWRHSAPGDCVCGIKRELCTYHK